MDRIEYLHQIEFTFQVQPAVALIGPRQCGKTTLARCFQEKYAAIPVQNLIF